MSKYRVGPATHFQGSTTTNTASTPMIYFPARNHQLLLDAFSIYVVYMLQCFPRNALSLYIPVKCRPYNCYTTVSSYCCAVSEPHIDSHRDLQRQQTSFAYFFTQK